LEQRGAWRARGFRNPDTLLPDYFLGEARENVRARWIEQGIWSNSWKIEAADNPLVAESISQGNETGGKGRGAAESAAAHKKKPPAKNVRAKELAA